MADEFRDVPLSNSEAIASQSGDAALPDHVEELTWALLDERITQDEMALLNQLLFRNDKARDTYIRCVQLHTDLQAQFAKPRLQAGATAPAKSPVLGFLNSGMPPLELQTPMAEDAAS
jgi:hypothetical protein